jgi:hypothetical protein
MFNFLHPRPVVDGRAVAVQVVQQKASTRQETRTLIVAGPASADVPAPPASAHDGAENGSMKRS